MEKGSCLSDHSLRRHKVPYGNEKSLLEKFETLRSPNSGNCEVLCSRSHGASNGSYLRREPQHGEPDLSRPARLGALIFGVVEVDESFFGARRVNKARARSLWQDRRLRHFRTQRAGLHGNRRGLLKGHAARDYPRAGRPGHRCQLRRPARIQRPRRPRLRPLPRRPLQGRVRRGRGPYQRDRRLPGRGQSPSREVQGPARTHLPFSPQGDRVALQPPGFQQDQAAAKIPPGKPGGKNSKNRLTRYISIHFCPLSIQGRTGRKRKGAQSIAGPILIKLPSDAKRRN